MVVVGLSCEVNARVHKESAAEFFASFFNNICLFGAKTAELQYKEIVKRALNFNNGNKRFGFVF